LSDFFSVLTNGHWTLTINSNGKLEINKPDEHLAYLADQFSRNLFLDATESPISLKRKYNINEPMLIVENEPLNLPNITVLNIHVDGLKSKDISSKASEQVLAIINKLESLSDGESYRITHKKNCELFGTEYYYINHDRGCNDFKNAKLISFVGTPYNNLSAVEKEYDLYHYDNKDKFSLEEFFEQKAIENEIQGIQGRPRGHHRPHQKIVCAVFGTNRNLEHLKKFNINVIDIEGSFFDTELLPQEMQLLLAVNECIENQEKITQKAIAQKLEVKQGTVSKIFNKLRDNPYIAKIASFLLGGWKHANNLFQYLIDNNKGDGINIDVEKLRADFDNLIKWINDQIDNLDDILVSAFGLNEPQPKKIEPPPDKIVFNPVQIASEFVGKQIKYEFDESRTGIVKAVFEFKNRFYAHIHWLDTNLCERFYGFTSYLGST